jgi:hypothetical protein
MPEPIADLARGAVHAMLFNTTKACGLATALIIGAIGTFVVAQQERGDRSHPSGEAQAKDRPGRKPTAVPGPPAKAAQGDLDERKEQIERKLDESIKLDLPESMELGDFVKALKKATTDAHFTGLPIFVDPIGLQEAGVSTTAKVFPYRVKGAKLHDVLRWTLHDLRLSFTVRRDGALLVSSRESITDRRLEDLQEQIERLAQAIRRIEGVQARSSK